MFTRAGLLVGLVAPAALCNAQESAPAITGCQRFVISQRDASRSRTRPFALDLHGPADVHLVYLGVRHTVDPADPQWGVMEAAWDRLHPSIAFFEGSGTSVGDSPAAAIRDDGEPGLLRFLAARSGVPAHSLEPSREAEAEHLLTRFTGDQVVMFYALRMVNEERREDHVSGPALDTVFALALARTHRAPVLAGVLADTGALRRAFANEFPTLDPLSVPDGWFDPNHTSAETGSRFFNDVNRMSSMFRDEYMYSQLAAALQVPGARVFAEVGRDHVPAQAAALRCVLGVDTSDQR